MIFETFREPTEEELKQVEKGYNNYYKYGGEYSLDEFPVVIIEDYETADNEYQGRLAVVIDRGANATTYGFDKEGAAFLISDALNEKE
jgi:hypothetical protein